MSSEEKVWAFAVHLDDGREPITVPNVHEWEASGGLLTMSHRTAGTLFIAPIERVRCAVRLDNKADLSELT